MHLPNLLLLYTHPSHPDPLLCHGWLAFMDAFVCRYPAARLRRYVNKRNVVRAGCEGEVTCGICCHGTFGRIAWKSHGACQQTWVREARARRQMADDLRSSLRRLGVFTLHFTILPLQRERGFPQTRPWGSVPVASLT